MKADDIIKKAQNITYNKKSQQATALYMTERKFV